MRGQAGGLGWWAPLLAGSTPRHAGPAACTHPAAGPSSGSSRPCRGGPLRGPGGRAPWRGQVGRGRRCRCLPLLRVPWCACGRAGGGSSGSCYSSRCLFWGSAESASTGQPAHHLHGQARVSMGWPAAMGFCRPITALKMACRCFKVSHLLSDLLARPQARVEVRTKAACINWGRGNAQQPWNSLAVAHMQ